jgi:LCP family protein required for cell wall assembly
VSSTNPHGLVLPPELDPRRSSPRMRPRQRRFVRVLSWTAIVMSVLLLVGSVAGYGLIRYYDGNINRIGDLFRPDGDRPAAAPGKAKNFLLVGSDTREGATEEELRRAGTEFEAGRRADTMILIHLSAKQDKALLMSFPRDLYVDIPGKGKNRINAAFSSGGPALAIATVEQLTDIRIDHYIEVNFFGFQRMVDALGGVDVCLPKAAKEPKSGINLPAGRSRVQGPQALAFVRQREGLPRGDIDRIARQQQFLGAMLRRATSAGILLRPDKLLSFLNVVTKSIQVDDQLSFATMRDLAFRLKDLDPAKVTFVTVPVDRLARRDGKSVVLMDEPGAELLFDSIRNDDKIPGASPAPPVTDLKVAPAKVRVQVLNGAGVKGLASKAAADLREVGFRPRGVGNADSSDYEDTIVRYGPDREDSARTLAAAVPGAKLQLDQSMRGNVELIVGRSYSGTRAVTVRPSTAVPRPSGTASLPPTSSAADDPCA